MRLIALLLFAALCAGCASHPDHLASIIRCPQYTIHVFECSDGKLLALYYDRDGQLVRRESIP